MEMLATLKEADTVRLILGDQLNASHSWFHHRDDSVVYLIAELHQETDYTLHHLQKLCGFFAAMGEFAHALSQAGHRVIYLTLDESAGCPSLPDLIKQVISQTCARAFQYQTPDEYRW